MRNSWLVNIFVVIVCLLCRSAAAEELFKYNFIEVGYDKGADDAKGLSFNADTLVYRIAGSYAVHDLVAIGIEYSKSKKKFKWGFHWNPCFVQFQW